MSAKSFRSRPTAGPDPVEAGANAVTEAMQKIIDFEIRINARVTAVWVGMVMFVSAIAYVVMGSLYAAGVGLEGYGSTQPATVLPFYYLTSNVSTYNVTGFTSGLLLPAGGVDYPVVVSTHYATATTKVDVYTHTLGLLFTLFALNIVPYALSKMGGDDEKARVSVVPSGRVVFVVSLVLAWIFIQTDLMFLLGNADKAASWLASGVVLAQVVLYYVAEMDNSKRVIQAMDEIEAKGWGMSHAVLLLALIMGVYLWCMSVGVALLMPLHYAGGIEAIKPAEYKPVLAFYLLTQTVELFRFFVIVTGASAVNKNTTYEKVAILFKSNAALVFGNLWLFTLVTIYAFLPGSVINHAGKL